MIQKLKHHKELLGYAVMMAVLMLLLHWIDSCLNQFTNSKEKAIKFHLIK